MTNSNLSTDSSSTWQLYILKCADNTLYTGITNNLERRLEQHNSGIASKYTRTRTPVTIVYQEIYKNRSEASKRELQVKKLTRKAKLELIAS